MFNYVFRYKHYTKELETGPLSPYLDEFARVLFERGHSRKKVRNKFIVLGQLSCWLRRHRLPINRLDVAARNKFLRVESRRVVWPLSDRGDIASLKLFVKILNEKGVIPPPRLVESGPAEHALDEFEKHLSAERGMRQETIYCYKRYAGLFVKFKFKNGEVDWNDVNIKDIYTFMLRNSQSFSQGTNKLIVTGLRAFFRFLHLRGEIDFDLAKSVPPVPHWRAANLPYYLSNREVKKLLDFTNQTTLLGKRDFAILLLLVRLGLRVCEVASLTLDDLDWSNGELVIHGKGVRKKRLPIPKEVGKAIVSYIKVRKQNGKTRSLFLRSFPPYDGIKKGLVGMIVRTALARARLKPFKSGSHLLRHTAATEMLSKGASLTEIGMILGHQSINSTAIYAKVDLANLQPIARPWPTFCGRGGVQ